MLLGSFGNSRQGKKKILRTWGLSDVGMAVGGMGQFVSFFFLFAQNKGVGYTRDEIAFPFYPFTFTASLGILSRQIGVRVSRNFFFPSLPYTVYSIDAFWGTSKYFQVSLVSCDVTIQYMEWDDALFMSYYLAQAYAGPFLLSRETSNSSSYSYRMRKVSCSRHRKAGGLVGSSSPYSQVLR
jgi:hypothetical protein